jgi:hypothetical protein
MRNQTSRIGYEPESARSNSETEIDHACVTEEIQPHLAVVAHRLVHQSGDEGGLSSEAASADHVAGIASRIEAPLWQAFAGFGIELCPSSIPPPNIMAQQFEALQLLLSLPGELDWSAQLRFVAVPLTAGGILQPRANCKPNLRLSLLLTCRGATRGTAVGRVRDAAGAVRNIGQFLASSTYVHPFTSMEDLRSEVRFFRPREVVELTRNVVEVGDEQNRFDLPSLCPLSPGYGHWLLAQLQDAASSLRRSFAWIVTLQPAVDLARSRDFLDAQLHEEGSKYPWATGHAETGRVSVIDDAAQSARACAILSRHLAGLAGQCGRVQAFLCTDGTSIPGALIAASLTETTATSDGTVTSLTWSRPVHPRELATARRAISDARIVDWQGIHYQVRYRGMNDGRRMASLLDLAHLAPTTQIVALFHLPVIAWRGMLTEESSHSVEAWLPAAPVTRSGSIILGDNVSGTRRQPIAISMDGRRRHVYISGQTGVGKTTLMINLINEDLVAGRGLAVIDPDGQLVEQILALVPADRAGDVVLFDPFDVDRPVGFNFLENSSEDERYLVAEAFIDLLYKLFDPHHTGIVGPRLEHAVRNALLTAMSMPGSTLLEVVRILTDRDYVEVVLQYVEDPIVRSYWTNQVANTSDFHRSEVLDYIASKFSMFVTNRTLRNIIGQPTSSFSLRTIMDREQILLVSLAQGRLGEHLSKFLGMILLPKILSAALSRVDTPEAERPDFSLYVDEFQTYASPAFVDMLSRGRKYRLACVCAHQHVGQLSTELREAIFGNVGTLIAMRSGVHDAPLLTAAMQPSVFSPVDYIQLPNFKGIAQVLDRNARTPAFTLATRPAPHGFGPDWVSTVRELSRATYGRARSSVERDIELRVAT